MNRFLGEEVLNTRSQYLEKYYKLNSAICVYKIDKLLEGKSFFFKDGILSYKMDSKSSIDIDEEIDFKVLEVILGD